MRSAYRAVIFDLGGVVLESPFGVIAEYEREHGIASGTLARVAAYSTGDDGPWQQLERGQIDLPAFCEAFDRRLAAAGAALACAPLMARIADRLAVRAEVLEVVRGLRGRYTVAALTNIWHSDDALGRTLQMLRPEFDVFVESWRVGMRKPEPAIYHEACRLVGVAPVQAVFLDDIGANLVPARAIGMHTIRFHSGAQALGELRAALGA